MSEVPKGVQIAIGASLVALLLGWYGYTNLQTGATFTYYQTLTEFVQAGAPAGQSLRIHGYVSNGTIDRRLGDRQVHFAVQNDPPHANPGAAPGPQLKVVYRSLETPDLFRDGAEVVVEGFVEGRGAGAVLVADNVLAKCPSKFEAKAALEAPPSAEL